MKKICVISSGRWDYGHLYWIMKGIEESNKLKLIIFSPGNHHCIKEMLKEFETVSMLPEFNDIEDYGYFCKHVLHALKVYIPDIVIVLGDRYEIHAAATAATLLNIPIAHIHGGETTTGAFDDYLRNSITMLATWHFTAHWRYVRKVCEMRGLDSYYCFKELPNSNDDEWKDDGLPCDYSKKVYVVGAPGLDWLKCAKLYSKQELQRRIGINLNEPYILACFQPVTRELDNTARDMGEFLLALAKTKEQTILIRPNCDPGNNLINDLIDKSLAFSTYSHVTAVDNLDHLTYLSLMQFAGMMVGNSSSGIIEAASLNLPVVNVGSRQNGRIRNSNVFDCGYSAGDILRAMDRAMKWNALAGKCDNVYGDGHASKRIVKILEASKDIKMQNFCLKQEAL